MASGNILLKLKDFEGIYPPADMMYSHFWVKEFIFIRENV